MRPRDIEQATKIAKQLRVFAREVHPLPGIDSENAKQCFLDQVIDSVRRIRYVTLINGRAQNTDPLRANPASIIFDPLMAAVLHKSRGDLDEAFWLVFLAIHFGKNKKTEWRLVRDVYGALGSNRHWTWKRTSSGVDEFRQWLDDNQDALKNGKFGNHRKYENLSAFKSRGTGAAIGSYVDWIGPAKNHRRFVASAIDTASDDSKKLFDHLYKSMEQVRTFGRMAKFDYLTMVGKLELVEIEPPSAYLQGSTGPQPGARLLFAGNPDANLTPKLLNTLVSQLGEHLNLYFGMQVLEDALCNWQKSPANYQHFRG